MSKLIKEMRKLLKRKNIFILVLASFLLRGDTRLHDDLQADKPKITNAKQCKAYSKPHQTHQKIGLEKKRGRDKKA